MDIRSSYISLSPSVQMRKEHFGGIIFDKNTGTTIDVDMEAYALLSFIKEIGIFDINDLNKVRLCVKSSKHIDVDLAYKLLETLIENGILVVMPQGVLNENYHALFQGNEGYRVKWSIKQDISAPETVHWAVTFKCDSDCPDCYIKNHKHKIPTELDTAQAFKVINNIANSGVFQLAIGGGEPFIREDIVDIAEKACASGLMVHITTGRYQHENSVLRRISEHVKSIHVGIKHLELIDNPENEAVKLIRLITAFGEVGIDVGANLILSRSTIQGFDRIVDTLSTVGFKRLTLLRYKPPASLEQWTKEKPEECLLLMIEQQLPQVIDMYPHIKFRTDCGLTFMQRRLSSQKAIYSGIRGCVAADRIVSVAPDGSVFPCSQLIGQGFYAGNLLESDFSKIWLGSNVLNRYRNFRTDRPFNSGQCGGCRAKIHCGGCRVFALDGAGSDLGCPDPL